MSSVRSTSTTTSPNHDFHQDHSLPTAIIINTVIAGVVFIAVAIGVAVICVKRTTGFAANKRTAEQNANEVYEVEPGSTPSLEPLPNFGGAGYGRDFDNPMFEIGTGSTAFVEVSPYTGSMAKNEGLAFHEFKAKKIGVYTDIVNDLDSPKSSNIYVDDGDEETFDGFG
eukprot:m.2417 g.2417  ORF g.2417 m.2417 type:complete len:169 (-) comp1465_c0_seq1:164-670(-)